MSPFERSDAPGIDEILADGAVILLRSRGLEAVNVAALARWMGVSRQALSERLRGPGGSRRRILQLTLLTFAERWIQWVGAAMFEDPPVPALPRTIDEQHGVRVWAALVELARGERANGNPDPAEGVAATLVRERDVVRTRVTEWLGASVPEEAMFELFALTDGLRASLIEPVEKISSATAHAILLRHLLAMRGMVSGPDGCEAPAGPQVA